MVACTPPIFAFAQCLDVSRRIKKGRVFFRIFKLGLFTHLAKHVSEAGQVAMELRGVARELREFKASSKKAAPCIR